MLKLHERQAELSARKAALFSGSFWGRFLTFGRVVKTLTKEPFVTLATAISNRAIFYDATVYPQVYFLETLVPIHPFFNGRIDYLIIQNGPLFTTALQGSVSADCLFFHFAHVQF